MRHIIRSPHGLRNRVDGSVITWKADVPEFGEIFGSTHVLTLFSHQAPPSRLHRLSPADLALGLRILADLLGAGLSMSRTLATFSDLAPPAWLPGLPPIRDEIRAGRTLATALASSGLAIPPIVLGMIQAGEAGSGLPAAVRRAATLTESAAATKSAIRAALAYPVILAVAGLSAVVLLVGVVLPRFSAILAGLGQAIPPTTRSLLTAAHIVSVSAIPAAIALAVALIALKAWTATPVGRSRLHTFLLQVPVIGNVRFASATAHTTDALGSLLASGVPLPTALAHTAKASGDAAIGTRLLHVRERVLAGERLGRAAESMNALTPTAVRLIRAGEDTGQLTSMLHHAASIEGDRAQQLVKRAVRLLEPTLILAFGGLIAFVAAALLQAVYSIRPG